MNRPDTPYLAERLRDFTCSREDTAGATPGVALYKTRLGAHPEHQLFLDEVLALWINIGRALPDTVKGAAHDALQGVPGEPPRLYDALHEAVAAIYFDDSSKFRSALGCVVRYLDPGLASELMFHPKAAFDHSLLLRDARAVATCDCAGETGEPTLAQVLDFALDGYRSMEATGIAVLPEYRAKAIRMLQGALGASSVPCGTEGDWLKLDAGSPPDDGVYWARVCYPEYDLDAGDDGRTVGRATGDVLEHVALVRADFSSEDGPHFEPIDKWTLGDVPDEAWVTHLMQVNTPALPASTLGSPA
ncbi:hypothetical protein [Acidovorax sp.]|uniref:hypothetical protein n=1 Tax=Acidovorax sp. TaxID=1872122 RepID=UPI00391F205D